MTEITFRYGASFSKNKVDNNPKKEPSKSTQVFIVLDTVKFLINDLYPKEKQDCLERLYNWIVEMRE